MKREDIVTILGKDAPKEAVDKLLDAMHGEIAGHKKTAEDASAQAAEAQKQLSANMKEMKAISGTAKDADELKQKLQALQKQYDEDTAAANQKLEDMRFEGLLDSAMRTANGRNVKAIRALLDMDALKASKNQQADVEAAIASLAEAEDSAFLFVPKEPTPTGRKADIGGRIDKTLDAADDEEKAMRSVMGL